MDTITIQSRPRTIVSPIPRARRKTHRRLAVIEALKIAAQLRADTNRRYEDTGDIQYNGNNVLYNLNQRP